MAETVYPNKKLEDFWKTLWHVDVHKDHGNTYDASIINTYLPSDRYTTTQKLGENYISKEGELANRNGGQAPNLGFAELFKYLTKEDFGELQDLAPGAEKTVELNGDVMGTMVRYKLKVFDTNGTNLPAFVNNPIALFVDTTSHLPELLQTYLSTEPHKEIVYAYTREIESDPADKTTYLTISQIAGGSEADKKKNKRTFFYEMPAPSNPTMVPYPDYKDSTIDDGLSYFYCKFPVFLSNEGINDKKKYNLKTHLSYITNEGKNILVTEGANTAGAISKIKTGIQKVIGCKPDNETKRMVFISKHHGDVAQSLVKFRDVNMKCPDDGREINTSNLRGTFVSIDVNAIIKALTVGMPFIFMYPPAKNKIIVWKNDNLNTPAQQLKSEIEYTLAQNSRFLVSKDRYNGAIGNIISNRTKLNSKLKRWLEDVPDSTIIMAAAATSEDKLKQVAIKYKEYLQKGIQFCTLIKYIPKESTEITEVESDGFEGEIVSMDETNGDESMAGTIEERLARLKQIQENISLEEAQLTIAPEYTTLRLIEGAGEEPVVVSFEKDAMLSFEKMVKEDTKPFAKRAVGPNYSFKEGDKRVEKLWETTDLNYNIGDFDISSLLCRFGTKLNNSWSFDIIHYIYSNLSTYNQAYGDDFIKRLNNLIRTIPPDIFVGKLPKIETFHFGLQLIGIRPGLITLGGSRKIRRGGSEVEVQTVTDVKEKRVPIPLKFDIADLHIKALDTEFSDIISHLKLMIDMLYLSRYEDQLSADDFKYFGLEAFLRFFKVFGPNYGMFGPEYRALSSKKRAELIKKRMKTSGGAYLPLDIALIRRAAQTGMLASHSTADLETKDFFDPANFLTTTFSQLIFYESIVGRQGKLDDQLAWLERLRTSEDRSRRVEELHTKLTEINALIDTVKESEQFDWTPDGLRLTSYLMGGRRLRKFKTYKKSKTNKKRTLKRFK